MNKVYKMVLALVVMFTLVGCGQGNTTANKKLTSSDEEVKERENTQKAWNAVGEAFDKMKKVPITATGVHTEVAHITFSSKDEQKDQTKLGASYEQSLFNITIDNEQNARFEIYSLMEFINNNTLAEFEYCFEKEELTLDNLRKNHFEQIDKGKPYVYAVENGVLKENDVVTEAKDEQRENEYFDYLQLFKKTQDDFPNFLKRGITAIRLMPDEYFVGSIENNKNGNKITFTFNQDTYKYQEKMNIFNEKYGVGTSYEVTNAYVDCDEKDKDAHTFSATDEDGNSKTIYQKPALKEDFVNATIEIQLDKEGYPVSYIRQSVFEYKEQKTQIPYKVEYTFKRK